MRDQDRQQSVATALECEVEPFVNRASPLLRSGPFCLWGEVVSVAHGDRVTFFTVVDLDDSMHTLDVRLSARSTALVVGHTVAVFGRLIPTHSDPCSIKVVFAAEHIHAAKGPSRRQLERRQLVSRYARQRRAPLRRLRRIALVTSERSRALADFQRALAGDGSASVSVELFPVALNDPSSIARGIGDARDSRPDLIVVTRGGGDPAALLCFREPIVIEAVGTVTSSTPTVVAIGHAEDTLELDEIATWTVTTPTAAGSLVRHLAFARRRRFPWFRWLLFILAIVAVAWAGYPAVQHPGRTPSRGPVNGGQAPRRQG